MAKRRELDRIIKKLKQTQAPEQLSLTPHKGFELKDEGMRQALNAKDIEIWKQQFLAILMAHARSMEAFTSEDLIREVGLPRKEIKQNRNSAVGAMMNAAAKSGIIRKTGIHVYSERPSSHGAQLAEWIGTGVLHEEDPLFTD